MKKLFKKIFTENKIIYDLIKNSQWKLRVFYFLYNIWYTKKNTKNNYIYE